MTRRPWYTASFAKYLLILATPFLLFVVPYLRKFMGYGTEHYLVTRLASQLLLFDPLSYGGRVAAYPWAVPLLEKYAGVYLPLALGLLTVALFVALTKDSLRVSQNLALILLLISPPFITLFTSYNFEAGALVVLLLGFYLLQRKSWLQWLSIPVFCLLPLFSFEYAILGIILLFIFAFTSNKNEHAYSAALATVFVTVAYYSFFLSFTGLQGIFHSFGGVTFHSRLNEVVSEFSGLYGLGLFYILLAAVGIGKSWKEKYSNKFIFFAAAFLLFFMFAMPKAVVVLNLILVGFAAQGLLYLMEKTWENSTLKFLTVMILICGVLFSSVSHVSTLLKLNPDKNTMDAIDFLKSKDKSVVFSSESRGFWISYAGQINVMDTHSSFAPGFEERLQDSQTLFQTRDYSVAKEILDKYQVKYIWIDSVMKRRLWNNEVDGLWFIVQYSKDIQKVFDNGDVEIWEVK